MSAPSLGVLAGSGAGELTARARGSWSQRQSRPCPPSGSVPPSTVWRCHWDTTLPGVPLGLALARGMGVTAGRFRS